MSNGSGGLDDLLPPIVTWALSHVQIGAAGGCCPRYLILERDPSLLFLFDRLKLFNVRPAVVGVLWTA